MNEQPVKKGLSWEKALSGIIVISIIPGTVFGLASFLQGAPILSAVIVAKIAILFTIPVGILCYSVMRILTGMTAPNGWLCVFFGTAIGLLFPVVLFYYYPLETLFYPAGGSICGYLFYYFYSKPAR